LLDKLEVICVLIKCNTTNGSEYVIAGVMDHGSII